ncbi:MAG: hypothetical protein IPL79_18820 [Myxococcales bacterium]|nr:hypothetical protein [Myxococcales bacterium]
MNQKLSAACFLGAMSAIITACGDGTPNLRIGNVVSRSGDACTDFSDDVVWGKGTFDVYGYQYFGENSQFRYAPPISVFYEPVATGTGNDSPDVYLNGVNVRLTSLTDGVSIGADEAEFSSQFRAYYEGDTFFVSPTMIPSSVGAALSEQIDVGELATLKVELQAFGKEDGDDIVSPYIEFYVDVCNGCLTVNTGMCLDYEEGEPQCDLWQNHQVECCQWSDNTQRCPAITEVPPELPTAR